MTTSISLGDLPGRPCPIAASLELVGERWALLVIREIALGNTRFSDIVRGTGAPRDRITARLKHLEGAGIVRKDECPDSSRHVYGLTASGEELIPVLNALLTWGERHAVDAEDPKRLRMYREIPNPTTKAV